MALLFLFFVVGFGARGYFAERRDGTLQRVRAAPVRSLELLLGKALSVAVFGLAVLGVMIAATALVFHANWGDPLPVAVLSLAVVVSVTAITALVISLARTERQAEGMSSIVVFGFSILGGNFVLITYAPSIMRRLALLTPNGWALRGYMQLAGGGQGLGVIREPLLAIGAFTVVCGVLAAVLGRRTMLR
jgi:ABC-2 type transport system permease protein